MRVIRIYADATGTSHLEELRIALAPDRLGRISQPMAAGEGAFLRELRAGMFNDFHCAPRRQLVIVIDGDLSVEAGDGARAVARRGEAYFVEDTSGRGHVTRAGDTPVLCAYIPVAPQFDIRTICG